MRKYPFYKQVESKDCGPTCLRMIARFHGIRIASHTVNRITSVNRDGTSLLSLCDAAESIGFRTLMAKIPIDNLLSSAPTPFIVPWRGNHFVVVYEATPQKITVADPAFGLISYIKNDFKEGWLNGKHASESNGVALFIEPTPDISKYSQDYVSEKVGGIGSILPYLSPYKKYLFQIFLGLIAGTFLQLILPILTQSIVDIGIGNRDLTFVNVLLAAQLTFFASRTFLDLARTWLLFHIGSRINIALLSDFLIKLMRLPIAFYDSKQTGDLLQRFTDHKRIENFLTSSLLSALFSLVTLTVFSTLLFIYSTQIFAIFFIGSLLYLAWILLFLRRRKELDYRTFNQLADNQGNLLQLLNGMQETKLQNCERQKRWDWERMQIKMFKLNIKSLSLNHYQQSGSVFINEIKNIIISYLSAKAVIEGDISLGMMFSVQFIIAQLNGPVLDLVSFIKLYQDAKISLERLSEIRLRDDEDANITTHPLNSGSNESHDIEIRNVTFRYDGPRSNAVLKNISLKLRYGTTTAIVGSSGSGKTTLLKMLLKFYVPSEGEIALNDHDLLNYESRWWRSKCGAVMQDGFIFSDTILNNIVINDENVDLARLRYSIKIANIDEFVNKLSLKYETRIGMNGIGLSQGQKQRILIARAVYRNPEYIFLDEATNSLDTKNEREIMDNLYEFFKGRTVVIVAHRLSTVLAADKIVVLDKGGIVESGSHSDLIQNRGQYYDLVKNQLDLN